MSEPVLFLRFKKSIKFFQFSQLIEVEGANCFFLLLISEAGIFDHLTESGGHRVSRSVLILCLGCVRKLELCFTILSDSK